MDKPITRIDEASPPKLSPSSELCRVITAPYLAAAAVEIAGFPPPSDTKQPGPNEWAEAREPSLRLERGGIQ